jgi:N-methylhydantoinase A
LRVAVPCVDIQTVGIGGGSLAWLDESVAGGLQVGPQSAGALPGPACFGKGGRKPTVTDASLLLDRLVGDRTDLGLPPLDSAAAEQAMLAEVCSGFGMKPKDAAKMVLEVAEAGMAAFVRGQLMARGISPGRTTLIAFGGAGPVHAAPVAQRLGLKRVVVPYLAAGFSALGCLLCPPAQVALAAVNERLLALSPARLRELCAAALPVDTAGRLRLALIIRRGENPHEDLLLVRDAEESPEARVRRYQTFAQNAYGVRPAAETIRAVRLLAVLEHGNSAIALGPSLEATFHGRQEHLARVQETEPTFTLGGTPLVPVESLAVGRQVAGPALVILPGASAFVPPSLPYHVDRWGNLILEIAA